MIDEIINFEDALKKSSEKVHNESNEQHSVPPSGLNILFTNDNDHNIVKWGIFPYEKMNIEKIFFDTDHLEKCGQLYPFTTGLSNNKRHDRKNESCSLFSYVLRLQAIEDIQTNSSWEESVENFQLKAAQYFELDRDLKLKNDFQTFLIFLKNEFIEKLKLINESVKNYNQNEKKEIKFDKVYIFFDTQDEYYKEAQLNCLKGKTFSEKVTGTSGDIEDIDSLKESDLLSGFSDRKEFLQHRTAMFQKDFKVPSSNLTIINSFITKLKNNFPKPLPIFIDKDELNRDFIKIYEKDKKLTYADIFERIYSKEEGIEDSDLQNYYLLYAQVENKKFIIKDFEFVPSFNYKLGYKIESAFEDFNKFPRTINNIFEFQRIIIRELFDNCLFKKDEKTDNYTNNYWGEVKAQFCKSNNNYRLILQYRKAFYDFVYKSKKQALTGNMIKDIILSGVIDALQDEKYRNKNSAKEERIKALLTIYFNLNQYFDTNNSNFNKINISMATKTKELLAYAKELVSDDEKHFEENEDMQFAFCFGQLVYYLLSQSEASNKTHSLVLAYLQKSDFELLKQKAKEDATKYSYKISFNNRRFNKMSGEVFGYIPKTNFADLNSFFLAGYFSKNIIY